MSTTSFLILQNLKKIYGKGSDAFAALDGVSLSIERGEVFALLGINGAGKSTLSSLLATQHPPTEGDIVFKGQSIYADINAFRRAMGYCPQHANLDPYLTVIENLVFAGRCYGLSAADAHDRATYLLEKYLLTRWSDRRIDELSGGTRQRVLIARALMHSPEIVILDEPTVGLDPDVRRMLWDHISELRDEGVTVILTTHYLDEAEVLADRVCLLRDGKVQLIRKVSELKDEHKGESLETIFIRLSRQEKEAEKEELLA
jgi:ABC-2 type transport system ATP-binding protein